MQRILWPALAALIGVGLAGCVGGEAPPLLAQGEAPDFENAPGDWIGTAPLDLQGLAGQVVLVDFWTYSCINCIRTLPHLTGWHETYKDHGLVIVGVHAPEFDFEKDRNNVIDAMDRFGIEYPVVQDNDRLTWRAYENRFWPAKYLIDAEGVIRYHHFGEGAYDATQSAIRELLGEAGYTDLPPRFDRDDERGERGTGITRELYAGTWRQPDTLGPGQDYDRGRDVDYDAGDPADHLAHYIYLDGTWTNGHEALTADAGGDVWLRFRAGAANIVADGPPGACLGVELDGAPIDAAVAGADVRLSGPHAPCIELAQTPRSYDIYAGDVATHQLRLMAPAGFSLYTFAFSSYPAEAGA